jgi:hypothetical protein
LRSILKLFHLIGLVLFLGTIFTFAVASAVPARGDFGSLAVARRIISAGTFSLTLPGLALLIISGIGMVWRRADLARQGWVRTMALAGVVIAINAFLVVAPAVRAATALVEAAISAGALSAGYAKAYTIESVAGGVNILLALAAMASAVVRFGATKLPPPDKA